MKNIDFSLLIIRNKFQEKVKKGKWKKSFFAQFHCNHIRKYHICILVLENRGTCIQTSELLFVLYIYICIYVLENRGTCIQTSELLFVFFNNNNNNKNRIWTETKYFSTYCITEQQRLRLDRAFADHKLYV